MNPVPSNTEMILTEREGIFPGGGGVKLHYRGHRVEAAPFRAVVAVIESPEDGGRLYAELVQLLTPVGFALYGCAHHQHRRIPGQTGFLEEWNDLYRDLDAFLDLVRAHEPDAPLFLAGGQVAGQLAMTYALHRPDSLQGIIAYQPRMHRPTDRSPVIWFAKVLSRIWPAFLPTAVQDAALEPDMPLDRQHPASTSGADLPTHAAISAATASEIAIPILVIDTEVATTSDTNHGGSHDTSLKQSSLQDVEPWLRQVLSETAP
jgi:alpha-beta hydrolase superfamily lysophospholipase